MQDRKQRMRKEEECPLHSDGDVAHLVASYRKRQ